MLLDLLPRYADWGYQELHLHLEDAVEYPSLPGVARPHAFTHRQLGRLVDAAHAVGIGVVPIANLLGHTQYLIKVPELRELNELRDASGDPLVQGQICPLHPRFTDIASKLVGDLAPFCTAGKLHAGLDESFHLGKCPRCRAEVRRHGLAYHFSQHVRRLHRLVSARGLRLGLWADMLAFVPEAIPQLPSDVVAYDWYYYPFARRPRVEFFNFAELDLAAPLRARGIEYWGCPMNGAFRWEPLPVFSDRLANIRSWWRRCREVGAAGLLVSSWETYRLAFELTAVVDAAAASLWLDGDGENASDRALLERGFARVFGRRHAAASARAALATDAYPFSGYARWELNDRWDVRTHPGALAAATVERRALDRLQAGAEVLPEPLRSSLRFRAYLGRREQFVAAAAQAVRSARRQVAEGNRRQAVATLARLAAESVRFSRALAAGRVDAETLWRRTRRRSWPSQNRAVLEADAARLRELQAWIRTAAGDLSRVWTASPVHGTWQLTFVVRNFAPAVQRVCVEHEGDDGRRTELRGRHTIEFLASAAKRRARIDRVFECPIDLPPDFPGSGPALQLVIRGVGEVGIADIALTNGVVTRRGRLEGGRKRLGRPAPSAGLPEPAAETDRARLVFSAPASCAQNV